MNAKEKIHPSSAVPIIEESRRNGLPGARWNETYYSSYGLALRAIPVCGKTHPGQVVVSGKAWHIWGDQLSTHSPVSIPSSSSPLRHNPSVHILTMPDSWDQPWSDNPHAPHIMKYEYIAEKATLAGSFIGSILYGTPAHTFVYSHSLRLFGLF